MLSTDPVVQAGFSNLAAAAVSDFFSRHQLLGALPRKNRFFALGVWGCGGDILTHRYYVQIHAMHDLPPKMCLSASPQKEKNRNYCNKPKLQCKKLRKNSLRNHANSTRLRKARQKNKGEVDRYTRCHSRFGYSG